jgi:hypothetical protein
VASVLIRRKREVAIDDDADRKTRPDRHRRLDIEVAANDLLDWLRLSVVPRRSAVTTALSLLVAPSSAPPPSTVESAAAC